MRKNLLVWMILLCACTQIQASNEWTAHMSYYDVTKSIYANDRIYALASGSVFYYTPEKGIYTMSKSTGLSDVNILYFVYNKDLARFIIVYSNYNIDILETDDKVINIPQYKNSSVQDKTVNNVSVVGNNAYLSTNFGVVVVNMELCEFSNTYDIGKKVTSIACTEDCIFAMTEEGVYAGLRKLNLLDKNNWKLLTGSQNFMLLNFNEDIYAFKNDGLYSFDEADGTLQTLKSGNYVSVNPNGDKLVLCGPSEFVTMDADGVFKSYPLNSDYIWASWDGTSFWANHPEDGIQYVTNENDVLQIKDEPIKVSAPVRNLCYKLSYTKDNRLLVAGGSLNYVALFNPATIMAYDKNGWTHFEDDEVGDKIGRRFVNVTGIAQDPNDDTHHYISAACCGLYEYKDGKFVRLYDCDNRPIMTIRPKTISQNYRFYGWTTAVTYDKEGNLWFMNNQVDTVLHIIKPDGQWLSYYFPEIAGYPTFDNIYFDSRGWVWINHRRKTSEHKPGIFCLNYNGTVDDTSDDVHRFQSNFDGADDINQVYCVVEDKDGIMWIGTSQGPFIIRDPRTFFDAITNFEQIIVPRNDGTDYGDYLLSGVAITDIAIDGGNRKWFATAGNGVYLVSADGLTTIHHFTKENSPLLSNTVYSIAINGESGEVFFGTEAGLISYKSDATNPEPTLNAHNLKAYPNPVRPEYNGNVTVTGFTYDCEVKVVTVGGQLVYKGTSVGGTFTWNCRTNTGKRAASGVYYIIGYDDSGNKAATTKVLVMK